MKLWIITYLWEGVKRTMICDSLIKAGQYAYWLKDDRYQATLRTIDTNADTLELSEDERKQLIKQAGL